MSKLVSIPFSRVLYYGSRVGNIPLGHEVMKWLNFG